uniref:RNA-dependent RNA polymerase n=1 Tax=Apple narna-like virus 2 TaxID=2709735 RepID=A0A6C0X193_9VIRU|nr:MAG: RNA-dependent RNA polymerase [Apple narna-like virus 2]
MKSKRTFGARKGSGKTKSHKKFPKPSKEVKNGTDEEALKSCATIFDRLMTMYGILPRKHRDWSPTVKIWLNLCQTENGGWLNFMKYKLASFFAYHTDQEVKPWKKIGDNPAILMGGSAYLPVRNFLSKNIGNPISRFKQLSFLNSILFSKKGMVRPAPEELKRQEWLTFYELTRMMGEFRAVKLRDWTDVRDNGVDLIAITKLELRAESKRLTGELFSKATYTTYDRTKVFTPSTSANYINSRSNAGAIGVILRDKELLEGLRNNIPCVKIHTETDNEERIEDETLPNYTVKVDTTDLEKRFEKLWVRMLGKALQEEPRAIPLGLAEPLKTRVITKGPAYLYTVLKPLQKKMWSVLKDHKAFQYIGEPTDEVSLSLRFGKKLGSDEFYKSIDYSNATNGLHSYVSEMIMEDICDILKLYKAEKRLAKRALTEHLIVIKKKTAKLHAGQRSDWSDTFFTDRWISGFDEEGNEILSGQQTIGQLMGSILSFPILCMANALVCRIAYEQGMGKKYDLQSIPISINGDDALLRCNETVSKIHDRLASSVGLEPSIGKVYKSREFATINSQLFMVDPTHLAVDKITNKAFKCHFRLVPYVNLGLIFGMKRSEGGHTFTDQAGPNDIGARTKELLRLTPQDLRQEVFEYFKENNPMMKTLRLPWFVPTWLGGLGIPQEFGDPSDLDLRIAGRILQNWREKSPVSLQIPSQWRIRDLAVAKAPKPHVVLERIPQGKKIHDDYEHLLGMLGVSLLFDASVQLSDLFAEVEMQIVKRKIRHNEALWKPKGPLGYKLSKEKLVYDKRVEGYHVNFVSNSSQQILKNNGNLKAEMMEGFQDMSIGEAEW